MKLLNSHRGFAIVAAVMWILIGCGVFCLRADAQVSAARLSGVITDTSGGILPGAQITITDISTNITRDVTANQSGIYSAPGLPAGNYQVKVSAKGFETVVRTG